MIRNGLILLALAFLPCILNAQDSIPTTGDIYVARALIIDMKS